MCSNIKAVVKVPVKLQQERSPNRGKAGAVAVYQLFQCLCDQQLLCNGRHIIEAIEKRHNARRPIIAFDKLLCSSV